MRRVLSIFCVFVICNLSAQVYQLTSPNSVYKVTVIEKNKQWFYKVLKEDKTIISDSRLGLLTNPVAFNQLNFVNEKRTTKNETWTPVWADQNKVTNHYNELLLNLSDGKKKLGLQFRAFDEGIAFRYVFSDIGSGLTIKKELSQFAVDKSSKFYMLNQAWAKSYVKDQNFAQVNQASLPLLGRTPSDDFVLITEASLYDYGALRLNGSGKSAKRGKKGKKNKKSKGEKIVTNNESPRGAILTANVLGSVAVKSGSVSPWRVVMGSKDPNEFIRNKYIIQNLNAPCKIEDTSWIKPGITTWDWRARGAKEGNFTYKLDTESLVRFVEKTADLGLPYFMIDAEWYGHERDKKANPKTAIPGLDMDKIVQTAKDRNVGLWLYVNKIGLQKANLDELFKLYNSWGVKGIKFGFLKVFDQKGVRLLQRVLEKCAEYKIMFDCHEAMIPSGIERTWPNFMTREYNHSLEDGKNVSIPIDHTITPYMNNFNGSIDVTPGFFDIDQMIERDFVRQPLQSTVVGQAAMTCTYYSPLLCLPDIPEAYERKADLFEFIKSQPLVYDETRIIHSKIEDIFMVARRKGTTWWVAGLTNHEKKDFKIDLNFLGAGKYNATIYQDAKTATFKQNREQYNITKKSDLTAKDAINVFIGEGGGVCVRLDKK